MRYLLALLLAAVLIAGLVAVEAAVDPTAVVNPTAADDSQPTPSGSRLMLSAIARTFAEYRWSIVLGILGLCLATATLCPAVKRRVPPAPRNHRETSP